MKEKITGIILGSIRHCDRFNVTGVYTLEKGRIAMLTPAGTSRTARQAASRLQPLSVIEAEVNRSASRELGIASGITLLRVWKSVYMSPGKATVAMFLSEFLSRLLRDATPEVNVWNYISDSMEYFDAVVDKTAIANFHITFMVGMTRLMGIQPDLSNYSDGMEFDMQAGVMVYPFSNARRGSNRINNEKSAFLMKLARINYSNSRRFRFSGKERSEILDLILKYFGCHFPGCDNIRSLEILKEIFL